MLAMIHLGWMHEKLRYLASTFRICPLCCKLSRPYLGFNAAGSNSGCNPGQSGACPYQSKCIDAAPDESTASMAQGRGGTSTNSK
ncbi:hypothetical protein VTK56DRAFT_8257 [Thermocarpiscus australiensis]